MQRAAALWLFGAMFFRLSSSSSPLPSQLPAVFHQQDLPALRYRLPGRAGDGVHHAPPRSEPDSRILIMHVQGSLRSLNCSFQLCFMVVPNLGGHFSFQQPPGGS